MKAVRWIVSCVFSTLCFEAQGASLTAEKGEPEPLRVTVAVARALGNKDLADVFITYENCDPIVPTSDIHTVVGVAGGGSRQRNGGPLAPRQSRAERIQLNTNGGDVYAQITYSYGTRVDSLTQVVKAPVDAGTSAWSTLMPVFSSVIGACIAIVAAFLAHRLAAGREAKLRDFEWSKMMFEKYEQAYRTFLRKWGGSKSVTVLETQFEALLDAALIPAQLQKAYKATVKVLANDESAEQQKQNACATLLTSFEEFIRRPWYSA